MAVDYSGEQELGDQQSGMPELAVPAVFSPVEVRVAAELGQLSLVRALAETVALLADLTLDEVADVRLAVDEVASGLIVAATAGSMLCCEFTVGRNSVSVRAAAVSAQESLPEQNSFGRHLLRTLTDSIATHQDPYDPELAGYPTTIEFRKGVQRFA